MTEKQHKTPEEFYGEAIYTYTDDQAIEDGVLVEPHSDKFPGLILTANVFAACEAEGIKSDRTIDQVIGL